MDNHQLLVILKTIMLIGLCLIGLGVYLHLFSDTMHALGVTGIVVSASCVAVGMIMSIPTKMYLTFLFVKREEQDQRERTLLWKKLRMDRANRKGGTSLNSGET